MINISIYSLFFQITDYAKVGICRLRAYRADVRSTERIERYNPPASNRGVMKGEAVGKGGMSWR